MCWDPISPIRQRYSCVCNTVQLGIITGNVLIKMVPSCRHTRHAAAVASTLAHPVAVRASIMIVGRRVRAPVAKHYAGAAVGVRTFVKVIHASVETAVLDRLQHKYNF